MLCEAEIFCNVAHISLRLAGVASQLDSQHILRQATSKHSYVCEVTIRDVHVVECVELIPQGPEQQTLHQESLLQTCYWQRFLVRNAILFHVSICCLPFAADPKFDALANFVCVFPVNMSMSISVKPTEQVAAPSLDDVTKIIDDPAPPKLTGRLPENPKPAPDKHVRPGPQTNQRERGILKYWWLAFLDICVGFQNNPSDTSTNNVSGSVLPNLCLSTKGTTDEQGHTRNMNTVEAACLDSVKFSFPSRIIQNEQRQPTRENYERETKADENINKRVGSTFKYSQFCCVSCNDSACINMPRQRVLSHFVETIVESTAYIFECIPGISWHKLCFIVCGQKGAILQERLGSSTQGCSDKTFCDCDLDKLSLRVSGRHCPAGHNLWKNVPPTPTRAVFPNSEPVVSFEQSISALSSQIPRAPTLDEINHKEKQKEGGSTDTAAIQQATARENAGQGRDANNISRRALCEANATLSHLNVHTHHECLGGQEIPRLAQAIGAKTAKSQHPSSPSGAHPPATDISFVATMLKETPKFSLRTRNAELKVYDEKQSCSTANSNVLSGIVQCLALVTNQADKSRQDKRPQHTQRTQTFFRSIRAFTNAGGTTTPSTHDGNVYHATLAITIKAIAAETKVQFVVRLVRHAHVRENNVTFVIAMFLVELRGHSRQTLRDEFSNQSDSFCKYCLFGHYMFHQSLNSNLHSTHVNNLSFEPGLAFCESTAARRVREEVLSRSRSDPYPSEGEGATSKIEGKSKEERPFSYSCIALWFTAATSVAAVRLIMRELASDTAKSYRRNTALREAIRSISFSSFIRMLISVFDVIIVLTLFVIGAMPNTLHGVTANSRQFAINFALGFFKLSMLSGGYHYPAPSQTTTSLHLGTCLGRRVSHKSEGCSRHRAFSHHVHAVCFPSPGIQHIANDVSPPEQPRRGKIRRDSIPSGRYETAKALHSRADIHEVSQSFHNIVDLVSPMPPMRGVSMIISNMACLAPHLYCICTGCIAFQLACCITSLYRAAVLYSSIHIIKTQAYVLGTI